MPSKPLRFLYRKYAGQAPQGPNGLGIQYKYGDLLSHQHQSGSLGQLHQLGRELTKGERVQMYFALSDKPVNCPSQTYSSVGSASTNGRSINSKKDQRLSSPSRHRSKSQEFQSKYRLALSRSSPDQKHNSLSSHYHSSVAQLPFLNESKDITEEKPSEMPEKITQTLRQEDRITCPKTIKQNHSAPNQRGGNMAKSQSSEASPTNIRVVIPQARPLGRNNVEKFPRCHSSSTVDADRMDSSQYQYLLDDFSSFSSSTSLCSITSDPESSHFSARAQRPSTTTSRATQRLRDLQTGTNATHGTPRPKSRHNSLNKSPENQWPPRYAIIPSWPSYEDIQTLNSCGEHRGLLTQLYRRDNRRTRERNHKHNFWNNGSMFQPIHVVPSHTTMECTMCNLYSHTADPTMVPPNSPMVISHECPDEQSRRSTSYSLHVNRSTANQSVTNFSSKNHSVINSAMSGALKLPSTADTINPFARQTLEGRSDPSPIKSPPADILRMEAMQKSNVKRVSYFRPSKKDVSYSWDTCKFAYVKAKG